MENLIKVSKTTRASREGRLIFCPHCFSSKKVYHFAWAGVHCSNTKCAYRQEKAYGDFIDKFDWLVEKK